MAKTALARKNILAPAPEYSHQLPTPQVPPVATPEIYKRFDLIDGSHPWKQSVPEGYVDYPARQLEGGKVIYFNFDLAKQMGLIPENHPRRLTQPLQQKILETFCIRIVNEYEQQRPALTKNYRMRPGRYMATRYLQLQHSNKTGRTSGDGRSIWNGSIRYNGTTWDISSRGTGVTCLAPGSVEAKTFLRTGTTQFGYGCGTADIDELLSSAVMSEIFHLQGIPTERVLTIIDLGNNTGIGVRAGTNLLRPAHLFNYLKQGEHAPLKRAFNYVIHRQFQNGEWDILPNSRTRFSQAVERIAMRFAEFAARLEVDYIFAWLDWDGDNVLLNSGIIDYGSIRQFGLRHDQYRFDDVTRFSTSLNEQRIKARETIQTFAQAAHFIETKKKRPLRKFKNSNATLLFDRRFEEARIERFAFRVGLSDRLVRKLKQTNWQLLTDLYSEFLYFEKQKTRRKIEKLADGVNRPAILNLRNLLRRLPKFYLKNGMRPVSTTRFFRSMIADTASTRDRKYRPTYTRRIHRFQALYLELIRECSQADQMRVLKEIARRSETINRPDRITGNSVDLAITEVMEWYKKGIAPDQVQRILEAFIEDQVLIPEEDRPPISGALTRIPSTSRLLNTLLSIVHDYHEDI